MHRFGLEGAPAESAFDSPASRVATATGRRSLTKTRVAVLATAFFLLASWALGSCVAWGQAGAYEQIPSHPGLTADKRQQNDMKGLVNRVLTGSEPLEANQAKFEGWYRAFVFPQMTHEDKLAQLAETRETFLKDLTNAKSEPARQLAVRVALEEMKKIAAGNYHPAARYNAMLILGELNQVEAVTSPATSARPPRPLPAALQAIMEEWRKPNVTDAMTVACLIGARRHVDIDRYLPADQKMAAATKTEIYDRSMALLQSKAPETRKPLAHAYLKTIAADIVAYVGNPGQNGETVAALDAVIDDPASPDFLKAAAISGIGEMNLPETYAEKAPALMRSFAEASFGFLLHEIEALNEEKQYRIDFATRPIQGSNSGGYGADMITSGYPGSDMTSEYGGYPGSGMIDPTKPPKPPRGPLADERDYILENSRRRLRAYFVDTQRALRGRDPRTPTGLAKVATKPEDQELLKTIDDELDEVIDSMQDPELTIVQLIDALTARSIAMQTSLGVVPPADPVEAASAAATSDATEASDDGAASPAGPAAGGTRGPGARGPGAAAGGRGPGARGPGAGPGGRGPGARGPGARGPGAGPAGAGPAGTGPEAGEAPAEAEPSEEAPVTEVPAEAAPAP